MSNKNCLNPSTITEFTNGIQYPLTRVIIYSILVIHKMEPFTWSFSRDIRVDEIYKDAVIKNEGVSDDMLDENLQEVTWAYAENNLEDGKTIVNEFGILQAVVLYQKTHQPFEVDYDSLDYNYTQLFQPIVLKLVLNKYGDEFNLP